MWNMDYIYDLPLVVKIMKAEAKTTKKAEKQQKSLTDRISNKKEKIAQQKANREPVAQKSKNMAIG